MSDLGNMVVKIRGDITDFNQALDAAQTRFQGMASNFKKVGENLAKFVSLPILAIGAASVKAAADMEMNQAAFETMLGSAEKAKTMLADLADFAAKTPFQLPDLANASKIMLSFGISADKVMDNLKMLGDASGGSAEKLKSMTLAFSQIQSTGRLMGQDLLQLINAGFNPLQIISEKTGKTMGELKKEMEQGAISAEMVADAFKTATSEGGLFFGGMERASKTFSGLMSTLGDNVAALGRGLGELLLPKLKEIVTSVSAWVEKFTAMDDASKMAIIQYGLLAAAIGPVILGVLKLVQVIPQLKIALAALSANPIILAMLALGAAIAVVAIESKKAATQAKAMKDALSGAAELAEIEAALKLQRERIRLNEQFIEQNKNAAGMAQAGVYQAKQQLELQKQELQVLVQNYNGKQMSIKATEQLAAAESKRIEDELALARAASGVKVVLSKEQQDAIDEEKALYNELLQARLDGEQKQIEALEKRIQVSQETWDAIAKSEADARGDAIVAHAKYLENLEKLERESAEKIKQFKIDTVQDSVKTLLSSLSDVGAALVEGEDLWTTFGKSGLYAIASMLEALGGLMAGYAAAGIAASWFSLGSSAIPVPAAIAGAAAAYIAAGAVRAGAAQLAEGGIVMPTEGGTLAQIAEAGQPEAVIPLDRMGDFGGTTHLVVNLDSRPLLDKIFEATRNQTVLISAGAVV